MLKPGGASTGARFQLAARDLCRLAELPRSGVVDAPVSAGDVGRRQRLAALMAAYHAAIVSAPQLSASSDGVAEDELDPVVVGWFRSARSEAIDVVVGGPSLVGPPVSSKLVALNYPPGARGERLSADRIAGLFNEFKSWALVDGVSDVLSVQEQRPEGLELLPNLEDCLLGAWRASFAWVVVAQPVSASAIRELRDLESHLVREARSKSGASQDQAVELERRQARHRELRQAESSGLWRIGLLAGGRTNADALQIAALVASSADLGELPYVLRPGRLLESFDQGLGDIWAPHVDAGFLGSTEVLAALARPPSGEIPGIRLVLQASFDVTREADDETEPGSLIRLGPILDRNRVDVGEMTVSTDTLNRHTFVCGATGSGKTQTVKTLLEELRRIEIPWLVIEPTKAEYRGMGTRLGAENVIVIRPGDPDLLPAGLNPLEPEPGFPLQTHADLVRALFLAAFEADEPFPQILNAALTRCYEELGWDLVLGRARRPEITPRMPTLSDLQRIGRGVVADIGYGTEVTQNVRGFIDVRIGSLRHGTPGKFFEGGHPLDVAQLLEKNVVLEIEGVGDDRDKAFLIGTVVIRLYERLWLENKKRGGKAPPLQHVTVVEEAHRLLRFTTERGPAAHAVELFASLLAEVRAYGEGIIVAEQIPSKLIPDVIKNSALKVIHRLPALDDREVVGATMNLTEEQSRYIVTLNKGDAAIFSDGMDQPMLVDVVMSKVAESLGDFNKLPPLRGRFSAACGPTCQRSACLLAEMRLAQLELEDPGIVLWAELAVLSHILGFNTPRPRTRLQSRLQDMRVRRRECAIAHAVDDAVATRAAALTEFYSPKDLAEHVAGVMKDQSDGLDDWHGGDVKWQAGPFRWNDIRKKLDAQKKAGNWSPQLEAEEASIRSRMAPLEKWRPTLLFGTNSPSAIEKAADSGREKPDWAEKLGAAIEPWLELPWEWPAKYLAAAADNAAPKETSHV